MMNKENIPERIKYLCEVLNKANVEYYVNDNPTLTDNEYELLDAEETENYLKEIEKNEESKNN